MLKPITHFKSQFFSPLIAVFLTFDRSFSHLSSFYIKKYIRSVCKKRCRVFSTTKNPFFSE